MAFVWKLFDSIRKFAIRLIRKSKKYSKTSMKINSKFVRFDSNYRVESNFSDAGFVRNSFDSIRKFMIRAIRKVKNDSKNWIKINSKFVPFDLTPSLTSMNLKILQFVNCEATKYCLVLSPQLQLRRPTRTKLLYEEMTDFYYYYKWNMSNRQTWELFRLMLIPCTPWKSWKKP